MTITKDFKKATRKKNVPDYLKHNERFHSMIIDISGSNVIPDLVERLVIPTFRFQFARHAGKDTTETGLKEHEDVVAAILAGDEDKAERKMRLHVRNAGKMIQELPDIAFRKD